MVGLVDLVMETEAATAAVTETMEVEEHLVVVAEVEMAVGRLDRLTTTILSVLSVIEIRIS